MGSGQCPEPVYIFMISLKGLKKKAWATMSEYIRKRDRGQCFTCPVQRNWSQMQAGHFVHSTGRDNGNSRIDFEEDNVHCQCPGCNNEGWQKGKDARIVYDRKMFQLYGENVGEKYKQMRKPIWKPSREELEGLVETYKRKITDLA